MSQRKPFILDDTSKDHSAAFSALGLITPENEKIHKIPLDLIDKNPNNKYRVVRNQKLEELIESVRQYGVMEPVIVVRAGDRFRLVAGERRLYAATEANLTEIPAIIQDLDSESEADYLVDTNNQREQSISEKAWGYRMKYDAEKRRAGERTDLSDAVSGGRTLDKIANGSEESRAQIARLIRLTRLKEKLLDFVDEELIGLHAADQLSFLSEEGQNTLVKCLSAHERRKIKIEEAEMIRDRDNTEGLDYAWCEKFLFKGKKNKDASDPEEEKRKKRADRFYKVTKDCFPTDTDEYIEPDKREALVTELVMDWVKKQRDASRSIKEDQEDNEDPSENND